MDFRFKKNFSDEGNTSVFRAEYFAPISEHFQMIRPMQNEREKKKDEQRIHHLQKGINVDNGVQDYTCPQGIRSQPRPTTLNGNIIGSLQIFRHYHSCVF